MENDNKTTEEKLRDIVLHDPNQKGQQEMGAMASSPILKYFPFYISMPLGVILMIGSIYFFAHGDINNNAAFNRGSLGYFAAVISGLIFIFGFFDLIKRFSKSAISQPTDTSVVKKRKNVDVILLVIVFALIMISIIVVAFLNKSN